MVRIVWESRRPDTDELLLPREVLEPVLDSSSTGRLGEDWTKIPAMFTVVQSPTSTPAIPPSHGIVLSDPQVGHCPLI